MIARSLGRRALCFAVVLALSALRHGTANAAPALKVRILIAPASAGYVGVRLPDPQISPATRDSSGYQVLVPGFSSVRADNSVKWFPAVDAGVVLWFDSDKDDENSIGFGLGGHIVTYKVLDDTRFSPAMTVHLGSRTKQMFAGVLFTQAGSVRLPGGVHQANVPVGHEHDFDVIRGGDAGTMNFYAGVSIGTLNAKDD